MNWHSEPQPLVQNLLAPFPQSQYFNPPYTVLKLTPNSTGDKKHTDMTLMRKPLNEHARFIQRGTLFLLFCKKSPKYQITRIFRFHCAIEFEDVYRITTSTANTGNLYENNLDIFRLLKLCCVECLICNIKSTIKFEILKK